MKLLRTCITYVQGHMGYPSSYALVLFRYSKVTPYLVGGTRDGGPGEIADTFSRASCGTVICFAICFFAFLLCWLSRFLNNNNNTDLEKKRVERCK